MFQKVANNLNKKRRRSSEGNTRPKPKKVKRAEDWTAPRKIHKSSRVLHDVYQKIDLMFKSANGTLYKAFERSTGRSVCLKQFEKARTKTFKVVNGFNIPTEIYYHFKSYEASPRFVIEPIAWYEFATYYVIVMDRPIGWDDLFEVSRKHKALPERTALTILTQAVQCARDLFEAGICHRDIKDENLLVDLKTHRIKLIDFGSATDIKPSYTSPRGTPEYWPPEFYLEQRQTPEELTIWSLGCIYYIMLTGEWRFSQPIYTPNLQKEAQLSATSRALLRAMLCPNPDQRCKFNQLVLKNI